MACASPSVTQVCARVWLAPWLRIVTSYPPPLTAPHFCFLACALPQNIGEAIKYVSVHYSADLKNLVLFLLTKHHHSGVAPSIDEVGGV